MNSASTTPIDVKYLFLLFPLSILFGAAVGGLSWVSYEYIIDLWPLERGLRGDSQSHELRHDNPEIVQMLLENGANPNYVHSPNRQSALENQARRGNVVNVKLLLEYGADVHLAYPNVESIHRIENDSARVLLRERVEKEI